MRPYLLLISLFFIVGCLKSPNESAPAQLVYIGWDDAAQQQLYLTDSTGIPPVQLTFDAQGIAEFSVSPTSRSLVYTKRRVDGGTNLVLIHAPFNGDRQTELLCEDVRCEGAAWAHDGRRIVYERRKLTGADPRLWWWDSVTEETVPVFTDEEEYGYQPKLSPQDTHISYVHIPIKDEKAHLNEQEVAVFNFETGKQFMIPNNMNAAAQWHPTLQQFLLLELQPYGEQFGIHTWHVDMETQKVTDLSAILRIEDASPSWSNDGESVVFGRKTARVPMGYQLHLMRPDGSDVRVLTEDAGVTHGAAVFSADNTTLLYQRYILDQPNTDPSLWLYDLTTQTHNEIALSGSRPQWLK